MKPDRVTKVGRSVWFDLPVVHLSDAMSFYEGLLGWQFRQMDNSPLTDYVMIEVAGTLIGGLRKVPSRGAPHPASGHPLPAGEGMGVREGPVLYFTVENLAEKTQRARELGAELVGGLVALGNDRGSYQLLRDREGNLVGLWSLR